MATHNVLATCFPRFPFPKCGCRMQPITPPLEACYGRRGGLFVWLGLIGEKFYTMIAPFSKKSRLRTPQETGNIYSLGLKILWTLSQLGGVPSSGLCLPPKYLVYRSIPWYTFAPTPFIETPFGNSAELPGMAPSPFKKTFPLRRAVDSVGREVSPCRALRSMPIPFQQRLRSFFF